MNNPVMFKEWCEEIAKRGCNVLQEFYLLIRWNGYRAADLPDIQERADYIIATYGEGT